MSMPDFGQCGEQTCSETAVRLFDCAHHCMKRICLQHLIEHDRLIEHSQDHVNHLRTDLLQLWSTYSSLVNETKLRLEFEQKCQKYRQFIRDVSNLFETNSMDIEQYRLMIEKLKQNIDEEKQRSCQYAIESYPIIEQVKIEPSDVISSTDELDSLNVSLATRIEKLNNGTQQQQCQNHRSIANDPSNMDETDHDMDTEDESDDQKAISNRINDYGSIRKISGECPLWFDGAYGLTEDNHGMYICPRRRHKELYRHLIRFHKLTLFNVERICRAVKNKEDPFRRTLFESNEIVVDQINQLFCPFSIHNPHASNFENYNERSCRCAKPQLPYILSHHLTRDHRMSTSNAKKLVDKLKNNIEKK